MKKLIISFVIFAVIASGIMYIFNQAEIQTLDDGTKVINSVKQNKEVDLNTFLALYKS